MFLNFQEWIIITIIILVCGFGYLHNINSFFKKRRLEYVKPIPIFGNMLRVVTNSKHINEVMWNVYEKFPKEKYVGFFNFTSPVVVIKDVELIKKIGVKDFEHFVDHSGFTDEKLDPFLGSILLLLKGDKWREMRNTLSPAFTSSKIRGMFPFIQEIAQRVVEYLNSELKVNTTKEYDIKDLTSRFSNDVIASCTFGIQLNSFKDKNNDFFTLSKSFTQFDFISTLKTLAFFLSPKLMKFFNLKIGDDKVISYFHQLFISNMKIRESQGIERPDMIHLLMLAKKGSLNNDKDDEVEQNQAIKSKKTQWTDVELTAQALIFIFAGFDTISTAISFTLYELAVNPEVQDRLQSEIDHFMDENKEEIDYNNLNKLKYLDMVISETLRLWPSFSVRDRVCAKSYTLPPQNEESNVSHKINPGEIVWIPSFQIHRDPKYFKNPNKFDPERFSDENKASITPNIYMPFGIGPRICIGSRFALMEIKLFLVYFLHNFMVEPSARTSIPMKLLPHMVDMTPITGHHLGIKERPKNIISKSPIFY